MEAKKCEGGQCSQPVKPGNKYCMTCYSRVRYEMKKSGYLPAVVPMATAKALKRHGGNLDG
jgi:uncharacterized protein (DUF2237 family)